MTCVGNTTLAIACLRLALASGWTWQTGQEDLVALWKLWVPSTFLNFALMPMWARIPWVATTSLLWTCILSAMRGSEGTFEAHEELAEDIMLNPGRALTRVLSRQCSHAFITLDSQHSNSFSDSIACTAVGA